MRATASTVAPFFNDALQILSPSPDVHLRRFALAACALSLLSTDVSIPKACFKLSCSATRSRPDAYDAGVPPSVSDRAAPFGIGGGRCSTATCCLQAQAAAPQAESIRSPVLGGLSSDLD